MLTALRREVQRMLVQIPAVRPPALRRSDDPGALLATDLPLVADEQAVMQFSEVMTAQGWQVWRHGDWLLMDTEVPVPECDAPVALIGEVGCCISLLQRHPGGAMCKEDVRAAVKAAENGGQALERLCTRLHAEWAAALREHRELSGGLLPYFCQAVHMTKV